MKIIIFIIISAWEGSQAITYCTTICMLSAPDIAYVNISEPHIHWEDWPIIHPVHKVQRRIVYSTMFIAYESPSQSNEGINFSIFANALWLWDHACLSRTCFIGLIKPSNKLHFIIVLKVIRGIPLVCRGWSLNPLTFNCLIPLSWLGVKVQCACMGGGWGSNRELVSEMLELGPTKVPLLKLVYQDGHYNDDKE